MEFTTDAVLALAPDDASAKAARGLVAPARWTDLGADAQALWGACQGSGSKPYQTQVDLAGPAFRCSCPSRKFPCKHGLALLLLRCAQPALFAAAEPPAWVAQWLAERRQKSERKEQRAAEKAAAPPPNPEDAQRRRQNRWETIEGGLAQLQLWLADIISQGLASLGSDRRAGFETMAARLVDAQAPGLAQRLREAASHLGEAPDWPERVLACFGRLQLVIEGVQRRSALPPTALADLQVALGWPVDQAEVLAQGEQVQDDWFVLGTTIRPGDARLQERRSWLQGQRSGRRALLLDFSHGAAGFELSWQPGRQHAATLAFFPSGAPLRALLVERGEDVAPPQPLVLGAADEWRVLAQRLAGNPWLPLAPMVFEASVPVRSGGAWHLHTASGGLVPLRIRDDDAWLLLAASGGHPLAVAGEWDGRSLDPLAAWGGDGSWQQGDWR